MVAAAEVLLADFVGFVFAVYLAAHNGRSLSDEASRPAVVKSRVWDCAASASSDEGWGSWERSVLVNAQNWSSEQTPCITSIRVARASDCWSSWRPVTRDQISVVLAVVGLKSPSMTSFEKASFANESLVLYVRYYGEIKKLPNKRNVWELLFNVISFVGVGFQRIEYHER